MGILDKDVNGKGIWRIIKKFAIAILFMFLAIFLTGSGTLGWGLFLGILYLESKFLSCANKFGIRDSFTFLCFLENIS